MTASRTTKAIRDKLVIKTVRNIRKITRTMQLIATARFQKAMNRALATKPYAAGGAYINRMSDHCKGCRFDPKKRTGDDACPYTTLYWDFLARNEERLRGNHRLGNQLGGMWKLRDLEQTRERAAEVLVRLDAGEL